MSKTANGGKSKRDTATIRESTPPLLSDKLIAQLQGAVSAAQRKRKPDFDEAPAKEIKAQPQSAGR